MKLIDKDALLNRMQNDPLFDLVERYGVSGVINAEPTVDAIPISWIKEWVEEIKDHPAYTEKEKTLCIEEFEDMLGAWAERKEE